MNRNAVYRWGFVVAGVYGGYGLLLWAKKAGLNLPPKFALRGVMLVLLIAASGIHVWWTRREARSYLSKGQPSPAPKDAEESIDAWLQVPEETLDQAAEAMKKDSNWWEPR